MNKKTLFIITLFLLSFFNTETLASHGWLVYSERSLKGKIINAVTKEPIEGAVLVAAYSIRICGPLFVPTCGNDVVDIQETLSDKNGEFKVPFNIFFHPWPFTLGGEDTYFIVFKPGYKFLWSDKEKLRKEKTVLMEPVPSTYYPRYEALERAKGSYQYWVDWQKTKLLKQIVTAEEKQLRLLERYPDGVIFKGFTDEKEFLINPYDIAVYKDYIYIGDGGGQMRIVKLRDNGEWVTDFKVWIKGSNSGGAIALALTGEGKLWVMAGECLKEYTNIQLSLYERDILCQSRNLYFSNFRHRFKVNKSNNIYVVAIPGTYDAQVFPNGFYIISKDSELLSKYIPKDIGFVDVAIDSEDNSYIVFRAVSFQNKPSVGIVKFNGNAEPVKRLYVEDIKAEDIGEGFLNITINDNKKILYLSFKDFFNIYDTDLNLIESIDMKNPALDEIGITAITIDKDGNYLYAIDSQYNRIIKYDLKNRRLVVKQKPNIQ